jgi:hypothetical protein
MLQAPKEEAPLQQGDVIADVPFLVLPKTVGVKAQGVSGQERLVAGNVDSFAKVKAHASGQAMTASDVPIVLNLGMVVTQSCDIDNKDQITLARVFPLPDAVKTAKDALEHGEPLILFDVIRKLTEGMDSGHLVYVGNPDGTGHQVADLLRVQSYPKEWKECFRQKRVIGLSDDGLRYLQGRLTVFSGRFATTVGFWQDEQLRQLAQQAHSDRNAIREAYDRLREKMTKPTEKT